MFVAPDEPAGQGRAGQLDLRACHPGWEQQAQTHGPLPRHLALPSVAFAVTTPPARGSLTQEGIHLRFTDERETLTAAHLWAPTWDAWVQEALGGAQKWSGHRRRVRCACPPGQALATRGNIAILNALLGLDPELLQVPHPHRLTATVQNLADIS